MGIDIEVPSLKRMEELIKKHEELMLELQENLEEISREVLKVNAKEIRPL